MTNELELETPVCTHVQLSIDTDDYTFIDICMYTGEYTHIYFLTLSVKRS